MNISENAKTILQRVKVLTYAEDVNEKESLAIIQAYIDLERNAALEEAAKECDKAAEFYKKLFIDGDLAAHQLSQNFENMAARIRSLKKG